MILIYLVLGCFMDQLAILVLTLPIVFPMIERRLRPDLVRRRAHENGGDIGLITPPLAG